ncbi:oxidoreductase [Enterococcus durans IPLA 655]|uniref:NADP-dependent oxidoreductase n=1 Tax=Enterococcus durans TaxID=53345 RepID=UPI00032851C0|nr:NADP-dependent oxidoreductase [Enterococcus durans]EMS74317.1 oxidoreductase [Enterococcus durans IPLA 655]
MNIIEITQYGGPEVARVQTVESPIRRTGEALVQVVASSINPVDIKHMTPNTIQKIQQFPMVLGWDITGIVIETGPDSNFSIGDRVISFHPQGSWQQQISISESQLVKLPNNIDFINGASIPLASLTAIQALRRLQLKTTDTLLITGVAGAVGNYALQIAKESGLNVSGLVRNSAQQDSSAPVSENIYTLNDELPNFDAVFDTAGILDRTDFLKLNGKLITVSDDTIHPNVIKHTSFAEHNYVQSIPKDLEAIVQLVAEEKIQTRVSKVYGMNEIQEAIRQASQSGNNGKIILSF